MSEQHFFLELFGYFAEKPYICTNYIVICL